MNRRQRRCFSMPGQRWMLGCTSRCAGLLVLLLLPWWTASNFSVIVPGLPHAGVHCSRANQPLAPCLQERRGVPDFLQRFHSGKVC